MVKKAFGYLRVSGASQTEGDGFQRQELAIRQYAKANGWEIQAIYQETISGTKEERPELARLMVSLEQNGHGIQTVIVEKLDRLARDLMIQEGVIRDFQRGNFQLISALEGPDLCADDPSRKLIRQVLGAIAEYDKRMIVLKLKAARERTKAKTGRCEGRLPYGQTPQELETIRRIRNMRRIRKGGFPGLTMQAIADTLNAEGIPTRFGKKWTPGQVHVILNRK